jgi:hypothetical protein
MPKPKKIGCPKLPKGNAKATCYALGPLPMSYGHSIKREGQQTETIRLDSQYVECRLGGLDGLRLAKANSLQIAELYVQTGWTFPKQK